MKKILTILIIVLALLLIYSGYKDNKIYYLSLGDFLSCGTNDIKLNDYGYFDYINESLKDKINISVKYDNSNTRSIDLINDIKNNKKILINNKYKTIQNALIKADIITLSVGMNDLFNNVKLNNDFSVYDLYNKFDNVYFDLEELFKLIRIYSKEQIFYVGLYSNDKELNIYMDERLERLCKKYQIDYIKTSDLIEKLDSKYFNKLEYKVIADRIINKINEKK